MNIQVRVGATVFHLSAGDSGANSDLFNRVYYTSEGRWLPTYCPMAVQVRGKVTGLAATFHFHRHKSSGGKYNPVNFARLVAMGDKNVAESESGDVGESMPDGPFSLVGICAVKDKHMTDFGRVMEGRGLIYYLVLSAAPAPGASSSTEEISTTPGGLALLKVRPNVCALDG